MNIQLAEEDFRLQAQAKLGCKLGCWGGIGYLLGGLVDTPY